MKNKSKKIIILAFITAMIIAGAVNLFIFSRILKKNLTANLESELLLLGNNLQTQIKRITSLGISSRDIEGFDSQCLEVTKKHQYISQTMIVDSRGVIIFHNSPAKHGHIFPLQNISEYIQAGDEKVLAYTENTETYYCAILPFSDAPGLGNEYAVIATASTAFISHRIEDALKSVCIGMFLVLLVTATGFYLLIAVVFDSKSQVKSPPVNAEKITLVQAENCDAERKPHIWIWEVDTTGKYTYSNSEVTALLGYSPEELVGKKHFYDMFILQERETLKVLAFEKFAERTPFEDFINANLHKNGQVVWLATSGTPLLDEDGVLLGYRGRDILLTERGQNIPAESSTASGSV